MARYSICTSWNATPRGLVRRVRHWPHLTQADTAYLFHKIVGLFHCLALDVVNLLFQAVRLRIVIACLRTPLHALKNQLYEVFLSTAKSTVGIEARHYYEVFLYLLNQLVRLLNCLVRNVTNSFLQILSLSGRLRIVRRANLARIYDTYHIGSSATYVVQILLLAHTAFFKSPAASRTPSAISAAWRKIFQVCTKAQNQAMSMNHDFHYTVALRSHSLVSNLPTQASGQFATFKSPHIKPYSAAQLYH